MCTSTTTGSMLSLRHAAPDLAAIKGEETPQKAPPQDAAPFDVTWTRASS